jgi:hypothetical protein
MRIPARRVVNRHAKLIFKNLDKPPAQFRGNGSADPDPAKSPKMRCVDRKVHRRRTGRIHRDNLETDPAVPSRTVCDAERLAFWRPGVDVLGIAGLAQLPEFVRAAERSPTPALRFISAFA